jgi:hypothetical protein
MWIQRDGNREKIIDALEFASNGELWFGPDPLYYLHLASDTWAVGSIVLPRSEFFPHDCGLIECELWAFAGDKPLKALPCRLEVALLVDGRDAICRCLNPATWTPNTLRREKLGTVMLWRDQVLISELRRPKCQGKDLVGVMGCSFLIEPPPPCAEP